MRYVEPAREIVTTPEPVARPERVDLPRVGHYRARRSSQHPWSPVAIFYPCPFGDWEERPRPMTAIINGQYVEPHRIWSYCAGNPITPREFAYLTHLAATPGQPEATPNERVDLNKLPPLYTSKGN